MIQTLTFLFLMLASFHHAIAETPATISEQTEMGIEQEQNALDNLRATVKFYSTLTSDEKKSYLTEIDITEEAFTNLEAASYLNWQTQGEYKLPNSHSTISIPKGYALLIGTDAAAFRAIFGDTEPEYLEALVSDTNTFENTVIFEYVPASYIFLYDWDELDPKELLEIITKKTEEDDIELRKKGANELHVIRWVQEPVLDKQTNTIYWAFEVDAGEAENIINAAAVRLGREGFERITWITNKSSFIPFGGPLDVMSCAHSFDPGYRYDDYSFGIAALLAITLGGATLKISWFTKFAALIFATLVALGYKFQNRFKRD